MRKSWNHHKSAYAIATYREPWLEAYPVDLKIYKGKQIEIHSVFLPTTSLHNTSANEDKIMANTIRYVIPLFFSVLTCASLANQSTDRSTACECTDDFCKPSHSWVTNIYPFTWSTLSETGTLKSTSTEETDLSYCCHNIIEPNTRSKRINQEIKKSTSILNQNLPPETSQTKTKGCSSYHL